MAPFRWINRHRGLSIWIAVASGLVAYGLHWWYLPSVPGVSGASVDTIEIELFGRRARDGEKPMLTSTMDTAQIQALLDVFDTASRASEHKCPNCGVIRIRKTSGDELELSILPGHDGEYFEYRFAGRINRVDRTRFVAALKEIGVEQLPLEFP